MSPDNKKQYLTLRETADYLSLPLSKVERLSSENRLPGKIKLGSRTVRVDLRALQEWLDQAANTNKGGAFNALD